jgi:hypothetical protein
MPPLGYIVAVNFIGEKKKQYEKKTTTLSKIQPNQPSTISA